MPQLDLAAASAEVINKQCTHASRMTTKYGMFKEHPYLQPGRPDSDISSAATDTVKPRTDDTENKQSMRILGASKTGKLNDATFGKLQSLYVGDRYVDPLKARLLAEADKRKKNVTDKPFKAASCTPKSSTPGDYYGTSGKIPYMPGNVDQKQVKGEVAQPPRGIYTSPAKKGSYGTQGTTLSQRVGMKGIATEYEYQHEPAALHAANKKAAREAEHKARVSEVPFKPSNPPKRGGYGVPNTTISTGKGVAGEWEYVPAPQSPGSHDTKKVQGHDLVPFKPNHAFASQRIEPIPYIHDPEVPKLKAASEKRLEESKRLQSTGAWKPTQGDKTDMVRSIVRMNLR